MPGLKDYISSDLDTFLNQDEFADLHDIDGQQLNCVVDDDVIKGGKPYDGVYASNKKLYVKVSDLPGRPVKGQHMRVGGDLYLVTESIENLGMMEITLEANTA